MLACQSRSIPEETAAAVAAAAVAAVGRSSTKGMPAMSQVEERPQVARKGLVAGPVQAGEGG